MYKINNDNDLENMLNNYKIGEKWSRNSNK